MLNCRRWIQTHLALSLLDQSNQCCTVSSAGVLQHWHTLQSIRLVSCLINHTSDSIKTMVTPQLMPQARALGGVQRPVISSKVRDFVPRFTAQRLGKVQAAADGSAEGVQVTRLFGQFDLTSCCFCKQSQPMLLYFWCIAASSSVLLFTIATICPVEHMFVRNLLQATQVSVVPDAEQLTKNLEFAQKTASRRLQRRRCGMCACHSFSNPRMHSNCIDHKATVLEHLTQIKLQFTQHFIGCRHY